ncbi:MAG: LytTR family DNA-binding domain-containing protein [Rubrivivax sp.]
MNATAPTALIAEDEPLLAASLQSDLAAVWPELQVLTPVGDGARAVQVALTQRPAVCFLDIRMPGLTGLQAAQALAEDWPDDGSPFPLLVFVTAYDHYAVQAFDAQAVDYLVKPLARSRLVDCVQRLQARLAERDRMPAAPPAAGAPDDAELQRTLSQLRVLLGSGVGNPGSAGVAGGSASAVPLQVIQAQTGSVVQMVPVSEVIYFEAADKYVRVVTAEREHLIRLSLRELLPQLDPAEFWQVHRGTVVQARCIDSARRDDSGKVTLSLARRPEKLAVSRLYAHLFKGM